MKLNAKLYKNLTGEPFLTQEIDGKTVEFYYMNDTPYLLQFASKARFAVWATDGFNYKVLVESKYYEAMKPFYAYEVNQIWINFLERVSKVNKKINTMFIIPTMVFYAIVAFVATIYLSEYMLQVLLGLLGLIVVSNMVQNRFITKKVRQENLDTQNEIREFIGNEAFDDLIEAQQKHYHEYFKFEDDVVEDNQQVIEAEVTETEDIPEDEKDKPTET